MELVDQRGMLRLCGLERLLRRLRKVQRDRNDLEPLRVKLFTKFLPDRQIESAPSPAGPREQKHFLPTQARQRERLTAPVRQGEVGRYRR